MEDKDEDAVRGTSVEPTQIETDLSDETQDFRLLSHLNLYARNAAHPLQVNANTQFSPLA
jgi:tRNA-splicing endonuclease subunit Sen54